MHEAVKNQTWRLHSGRRLSFGLNSTSRTQQGLHSSPRASDTLESLRRKPPAYLHRFRDTVEDPSGMMVLDGICISRCSNVLQAYVCSVTPLPLEVVSLCCGCLLPHVTERLVCFCHIMYQPTSQARMSKAPQAKFSVGGGRLSLSEEVDGQVRYVAYAHNPKWAMSVPDFSV